MDKDGKIEERKRYNAPFLRAFNYLAGEKIMNQKQFAKVIDAESAYISSLKAGTKRVGADYMARLATAFIEHFKGEGHLNMDYLLGKSQYMLVENVPDSEVLENINRGSNPDYDVMQQQKAASPESAEPAANTPDLSSAINAALSAQIETISSLKRELSGRDDLIKTKDEMILQQQNQLADKDSLIRTKDELITSLRARISDLQHQLAAHILPGLTSPTNPLDTYPFPIGAADHHTEPTPL